MSFYDDDPYLANVVLQVPMTGPNLSTTFADISPSPLVISRSGDARISTAQSVWGQGSGYFDGTGDYLYTGFTRKFEFAASSAVTVECWVYLTQYPGANKAGICSHMDYSTSSGWSFEINGGGSLLLLTIDSTSTTTSGGVIPLNQWVHCAWVRSDVSAGKGTHKLFVNGVLSATSSNRTLNNSTYAQNLNIATRGSGAGYLTGYLQDLRITNNVARYTTDFGFGAISGVVYERGVNNIYVPGEYPVYLYHRTTGELTATTMSAEDGTYMFSNLSPVSEYYVMALDNTSPIQRSAIVDKVVPS